MINPNSNEREGITLAAGYVRYILESRTPALPRWFIEGIMELYGTVRFTEPPLKAGFESGGVVDNPANAPNTFRSEVTVDPVFWTSDAATRRMKKDNMAKLKLLPLGDLFAEQLIEARPAEQQQLWRAQASLFIRWALDPVKASPDGAGVRAQALWNFLQRSADGPVTEALFQDCFGQGYAAAEATLREYLPRALRNSYSLRTAQPIKPPKFTLRNATPLEVSRVKGELTRLEIGYVRARYPGITASYIEQARRTLRMAYDTGEREPRLLAALGLCECDALDDSAALPFLQAATAAKVLRPRAYYEQARIEFNQLIAAKGETKPTVKELGNVLQLLATARQQSPAQVEVYELYAKVGVRGAMPLSKVMDDILNEGLRLFPRNFRLIMAVSILHALHGRIDETKELIARGYAVTANPGEREKLDRLLAAINRDIEDTP
ncbi:MAG: hypothetical protein K9M98_09650 [Cephaloticoccus sp.]|nr:hypothetical protein [Cephaloticoccus sp.]MCF7760757.1 hypothetical protein [Cephaloticoccus sp.]